LRPADGTAPVDCPICQAALAAQAGGRLPNNLLPATPSAITVHVSNRAAAGVDPTPRPASGGDVSPPWPEIPGHEILAELGRGGMGVVYKARQVGLNRTVAVKMLVTGPGTSPSVLARFRSEAEVIARLQQPNIIQVYEIGTCHGGPYFTMEYAEGGSLSERWAGVPQPMRAAARDVAALAVAVQAAHEQGIIHRDLKPANILLVRVSGSQSKGNPGGRPADEAARPERELVPKISDFGLARRLDDRRGLTVTGQVMGTPGYMAPEQARGNHDDAGPAADIYALGILLYEGLTGSTPYRGASALESVHLMLSEEPIPPSQLRPGLPRDLETICLHCLEKEPHKRYASAGQLADDLERFLAGEPIKARPTAAWERAWKWSHRHPVTAALAGALGLTVVVAFGLVLWQWRRAEEERQLTDDARRGALKSETAERLARHEAQVLSANLLLERGVGLCEAGEYSSGLLWLARTLDAAPANDSGLRRSARLLMAGWGRQLRLPLAVYLHDDEVNAAALSKDGLFIAAAVGNLAYLRSTDRGRDCGPPLVHGGTVTHVAFSPDGSTLATASADGAVRLWSVPSGLPRCDPVRHDGPVSCLVFALDGKVVLSSGSDGLARLWDAHNGAPRGEPFRHGAALEAAAVSPAGNLVATGGTDGIARLWDAATGKDLFGPLGHGGGVKVLTFSPDDRMLASGSIDQKIRLWDVSTGRQLQQMGEHSGVVRAISFSPDGRTLATGAEDNKAILWDLQTGSPRARLQHHEHVRHIAFSPGGLAFATASGDYTARLWAVDNGRPLGGPLPHQGDLNTLAFGPNGGTLLTASDDGMVRLWPTDPPGVVATPVSGGSEMRALAFSPDCQTAATCDGDGVARLVDLKSGSLRVIDAEKGTMRVAFNAAGDGLLTVGLDHAVRFWDTAAVAPSTPVIERTANAICAVFSPDGTLVATGSDDGECLVRLWDRRQGTLLRTLSGHSRKVVALAFSPDGKYLATASWDKSARLWRVADGAPAGKPLWHQDLVQAVAFSPDGRAVLTGGDDYTARLWELTTGKPLGQPLRHGEKIGTVTFSPDGSVLLTVGNAGAARLWDRASGKPLGPPQPFRGGLSSAQFSPDGSTFVTGGREGVLRRWSVPEPLDGTSETLWNWLHAHTGLQLDAGGAVIPLTPKAYYEAYVRSQRPGP
jgi:WD40 repeat protein